MKKNDKSDTFNLNINKNIESNRSQKYSKYVIDDTHSDISGEEIETKINKIIQIKKAQNPKGKIIVEPLNFENLKKDAEKFKKKNIENKEKKQKENQNKIEDGLKDLEKKFKKLLIKNFMKKLNFKINLSKYFKKGFEQLNSIQKKIKTNNRKKTFLEIKNLWKKQKENEENKKREEEKNKREEERKKREQQPKEEEKEKRTGFIMRRRDNKEKEDKSIDQPISKEREKHIIQIKKEDNKNNVYRSIHYTVMITQRTGKDNNQINKEIPKEKEKEEKQIEKGVKEITIDISKRSINTYMVQRKNSDATRNVKNTNTNTIPAQRVRHFTRKVEKTNRLDIEPEKKDVKDVRDIRDVKEPIGHKTISSNIRTNYEGTFKNSIRNKYKRIKMEKNS